MPSGAPYDLRRELYIEVALRPWAKKHGLTLKQAASIVCRDTGDVTYHRLFDFREAPSFAEDVVQGKAR